MIRPPLRLALLIPVLVTLLVGVVGLGVFLERSVRGDLIQALDDELERIQVERRPGGAVPGGVPRPPAPLPEPGAALPDRLADAAVPIELVVSSDGSARAITPGESPFTASQLLDVVGLDTSMTIDGDPMYRVRTWPIEGDLTGVAALSLAGVEDTLTSLRRNLTIGGLVLFVLQSLVVWAISSRVSKPVTRMSNVATRIADGDVDVDIDHEMGGVGGTAETGALARDLDHMVRRLRWTIEDRERAADDAERARSDMQRFLADASHELRTPLTALRGYSELHANGMLTDEEAVDRAMERIGSESERLQRLVTEMLQVVREPVDVTEVDVADVCATVVADLSAAHPQRDIALVVRDAAPLIVAGDANRLHQAVLNLGANACQHTEAHVGVEVMVTGGPDAVEVAVSDQGAGVDPGLADELFRPFFRGDDSRSRAAHDGAGLGLAIVRRIAEEHGGTVELDDANGSGATFRLRLPTSTTTRVAQSPR